MNDYGDYVDQRAEHEAYEAGAYRNEFEAAYDQSRREKSRGQSDKDKIAALVAQGRYVVYLSVPFYCRHTDAILGETQVWLSDHGTAEEALAASTASNECEEHLCVSQNTYRSGDPNPEPLDSDDIPF